MWDENDHFSRWVQGLCGSALVLLLAFIITFGRSFFLIWGSIGTAGYVAYRCLRYALTGKNNINRDDY